MRIIARRTLKEFVDSLQGHKDQKAVKAALEAWFYEVQSASWKNPSDVKEQFANASILGDRVIFNIKGNSYRLIVAVNYRCRIVLIKWLGSHVAYDAIDARTVKYGD